MTNPKLKVKIVGDEVFGLQKRERIRKFDDATIFALAVMMFNAFLRRFKKDLGCSSAQLSLSVALNNTAAEEFYLHLGFAEVAKVMEMKIKKRR